MKKPRQMFTTDEEATVVASGEERTLVAPRFDDEETLVARPVVPLEAVEPEAGEAAPAYAPAAHAYRLARRLPGRRTLLALMLVSVLVGGVLGGAGLYLYQRQLSDAQATGAPAAATTQPEALNEQPHNAAAQPAPTAEAASPAPEAQPADAATGAPAAEPDAREDEVRAAPDSVRDDAAPAREHESVPAAGTPKRGKKGERDEEIRRPARRADAADSAAPPAQADTRRREARRVDTISYRPRRAAERDRPRRQTVGDAERLRRIFEGTPE